MTLNIFKLKWIVLWRWSIIYGQTLQQTRNKVVNCLLTIYIGSLLWKSLHGVMKIIAHCLWNCRWSVGKRILLLLHIQIIIMTTSLGVTLNTDVKTKGFAKTKQTISTILISTRIPYEFFCIQLWRKFKLHWKSTLDAFEAKSKPTSIFLESLKISPWRGSNNWPILMQKMPKEVS